MQPPDVQRDFHSLFNSEEKKSSAATGGKHDWFSAHHQNSVKPIAWQPTDLRSPSIVCLIDYFPCNYSRCQTQYFTAPRKVQEGLSFLKDDIHIVTFVSPLCGS